MLRLRKRKNRRIHIFLGITQAMSKTHKTYVFDDCYIFKYIVLASLICLLQSNKSIIKLSKVRGSLS